MKTAPGSPAIYGVMILTVLMVYCVISIQSLHISARWGSRRRGLHIAARQRQCTSLDAKLSDTESSRPTDEYISDTVFNNRRNNYDYRSEQSAKGWLAILRSFHEVHSTSSTTTSTSSSASMLINEEDEDGTYLDALLVDDVDVVVKVVTDIPIAEMPETLTSTPASYRTGRSSNSNIPSNERRKMSEGKVGYGTIRREVSVAFRDLRYLIETSQQLQPRGSSSGGTSTSSSGISSSSGGGASSVSAGSGTIDSFNTAADPASAAVASTASSSSSASSTLSETSPPSAPAPPAAAPAASVAQTGPETISNNNNNNNNNNNTDETTALGYLRSKALDYTSFTHLEINFLATKMITLCGDSRSGGHWRGCGEVLALLRETDRGPDAFALTGVPITTHPIIHQHTLPFINTSYQHTLFLPFSPSHPLPLTLSLPHYY